jgi:hypothetical protein
MFQNLFTLTALLLVVQLFAQQPTQTIRGAIVDESSNMPLEYVSVGLQNTHVGTTTDSLGNFILKDVAIGRYSIMASLVGYEPIVLKEIQVNSAKEVFLNIAMQESKNTLEEIVVKPKVNKEQPLNSMATVSARMLSVEEAKRYAGGFDDPARLVSAFAGVSSNVSNNAIVVRGNSPQSLQWKLEGIEISNPNHFADLSAFGGGGLTALSAQLLANSDFFSGAMPAEYNNALSGVFDIFMRNGNNQKYEHTVQLGAIGIDVASEGPFKKGQRASYIFNYRYSTLGLLAPILPENAAGTNYQDLSLKLNFPTRKAGTFALWAMGLLDHSDAKAKKNINDWKYDTDRENQDARQFMGAVGISHKILLNDRQYLKTALAVTSNGMEVYSERLDSNLNVLPKNIIDSKHYNLVLSSFLNTKFSARHTNKSGFVITNMNYDMLLKNTVSSYLPMQTIVDENSSSLLSSAYSNSVVHINNKTSINIGIAAQWFAYNNAWSVEPRAGIKHTISPTQTLSLAYGLHSRLERLSYYLIKNNQNIYINKNLGFSKAQHFVLGYDISTSEFTHLKFETYYQYLFNIPVGVESSFSLINQQNDWFFYKKLQNTGKGRNYGLDITFEKYLSGSYYYMTTLSLFNSEYQANDEVWHNTRYNRNIALNFLVGKEWTMGQNKNHILSLNARLSFQGGEHYSPIDTVLSLANQDAVFDETKAFSQQYSPAFTSHFTASYKLNKKKTVHELALKIINLTQYKEYIGFRYNYQTQKVDNSREATFIPNISYKIEF